MQAKAACACVGDEKTNKQTNKQQQQQQKETNDGGNSNTAQKKRQDTVAHTLNSCDMRIMSARQSAMAVFRASFGV